MTSAGMQSTPEPGLLRRRLQRISDVLAARTRIALGYPAELPTADRRVLEQQIFPALARDPSVNTLVFAGCDWYTAHYERLLAGVTLHTLDPDPRRRQFGAARHHVAPLQSLDSLLAPNSVDAIVCNGVYGWGLDARADCERAFRACAACLRPGGWFVLGWNNVPAHDPAPLALIAFDGFAAQAHPSLGSACHEVAGSVDRHTFAFFRRTTAAVAPGPAASMPALPASLPLPQ